MSEPVPPTPSTPATPLAPASSYTRDRVVALSDGVFSIANTLLAFQIVPIIASSVTGPQFVTEIGRRAPDFVTFVVNVTPCAGFRREDPPMAGLVDPQGCW
jgi:hypothetical protein